MFYQAFLLVTKSHPVHPTPNTDPSDFLFTGFRKRKSDHSYQSHAYRTERDLIEHSRKYYNLSCLCWSAF
ncbi:hypothetical protein PO909_018407 [Leuciscus waleckii]